MRTGYTIIKPDGEMYREFAMLDPEPRFDDLSKVLTPYFREQRSGAHFERVGVLDASGRPTDMFVDEDGLFDNLPWNQTATRIYHRAAVKRGASHVDGIVIGGTPIAGVAIVFDRRVWF